MLFATVLKTVPRKQPSIQVRRATGKTGSLEPYTGRLLPIIMLKNSSGRLASATAVFFDIASQ